MAIAPEGKRSNPYFKLCSHSPVRELQALSAHTGGIAYSLVIRLDTPTQIKSGTINVDVGTISGREGSVMGRAGTALLAMLTWKRQGGEESKNDAGTEEKRSDDHEGDGQGEDFPIVRAKPCGDVLPSRKQYPRCHPGTTNKNRVIPTEEC